VISTPLLKSAPKRGFWKGPFCKVDAGARLFRHKKMGMLRPRARLGASTVIIKKTARATVMRTKGIFMAIFDE
jgi:hypothetical protein